jgi:hypothetical protein
MSSTSNYKAEQVITIKLSWWNVLANKQSFMPQAMPQVMSWWSCLGTFHLTAWQLFERDKHHSIFRHFTLTWEISDRKIFCRSIVSQTTCDRRRTCLYSRLCLERSDLILEDNFESIHRRMTILSEDCSSNQEKAQHDYENETNHRSKLSFSQFVEKINRTKFQKRRNKTNQQSCRTSCDAFNVKSKIHHRYHCQWYYSRSEFEFARSFDWDNASSREIFRKTRLICRSEQLDVFFNFNRFVIIIIRKWFDIIWWFTRNVNIFIRST